MKPEAPAAMRDGAEPPPGFRGEETAGAEGLEGLREAAVSIVEADPELRIVVGKDADGNPTHKTLRQYLDDELVDAADAREDAELVRSAAKCLYGAG